VFLGFGLNPRRYACCERATAIRTKLEILCPKAGGITLIRWQLLVGGAEASRLNGGTALERSEQIGIESLSTLPALDLRAPDIVGSRVLEIVELVRHKVMIQDRRASHAREEQQRSDANLNLPIPMWADSHIPGIGAGQWKVERQPLADSLTGKSDRVHPIR